MCIPRVPHDDVGWSRGPADDQDDRIASWPKYGARKGSDGQRRATPIPNPEDAWGRLCSGSLDEAWFNVPHLRPAGRPWIDRRVAPRCLTPGIGSSAIILSEWERDIARYQVTRAQQCGTGAVALRGYECRPDGDREVRLVVRTYCGTRRCDRCDADIRERQRARVAGPHRLFLTYTMPRVGTARRAWLRVHKALRKWHRELRRELAVAWRRMPDEGERRWKQRAKRIRQARARIRGPEKLEYAWCLEAHKDGWPHVHECVNVEWLEFGWAKRLWTQCLGAATAHIDGRRVWDVEGTCRYLSKYIAKGGLTPEILALIPGRRAWASTSPLPELPDDGYWLEEGFDDRKALGALESIEEFGADDGWELEYGKRDVYGKWFRPAEAVQPKCLNDGHPFAISSRHSSLDEPETFEYFQSFENKRDRAGAWNYSLAWHAYCIANAFAGSGSG